MSPTVKTLVTIITELSLETVLKKELDHCGATGYTISNAKGKGTQGKREANWDPNSNIRVEVICSSEVAEKINTMLLEKYYDHYAMISFTQEVYVLRNNKF